MNIGELFVTLGVKSESPKIREFEGAMTSAILKATALIASITGVSLGIGDMIQQSMDAAVGLQRMESMTGLSGQELQKWQLIAQQANVSVGDVNSSILALQRNIAEIRLGRGNVAPFQLLGIDISQSPFKILEQLRDRIKGLNRAQAVNLISQLGLSPDMIRILTLTRKELEEFSHIRTLNPEQEKSLLRIKLALTQFQLAVKYTAESLVAQYGPMIVKAIKLIATVFEHVISLMNSGVEGIKYFTENFKAMTIAIGIALAAVAIETAPLTAGFIALFLILDDLSVYFRGGKSLTGDFIKGFSQLFPQLTGYIKTLFDLCKNLFSVLYDIAHLQFIDLGKALKNIVMDLLKMAPLFYVLKSIVGLGGMGAKKLLDMQQHYFFNDQPAGPPSQKDYNHNNNVDIYDNSTAPADEVGKHTYDRFETYLHTTKLQLDLEGT